jgi:hypothetical protein
MDRLDLGDDTAMDAALMGAPRAERPRPHARGQPPVGTAPQDGTAMGTPNAASDSPLAAYHRDDRDRRPNLQCPRTGQCLRPPWCAIERTTPCLFGLYSVVALLAQALHPSGKIPVQRTAWYNKSHATFADALAAVRQHLWGALSYATSAHNPHLIEIPKSELYHLVQAVCYSH